MFLAHWPNGGKRGVLQAARLKRMGARRGPLDYWWPLQRAGYVGLVFDLKAGKGSLTKEQRWWRDWLRSQGWRVESCGSWSEAWELVKGYLSCRAAAEGGTGHGREG